MSAVLPQLVDAAALAARLDDPRLRIFDATVYLPRPPGGGPYEVVSGRPEYEREHIPGAAFADIPGELSDPHSRFPFTVPAAQRFAQAAGRLGIRPDSHVVAYSHTGPMWATRLWWLLRQFGHDAVSVLDGGLPAWKAAGMATDDRPTSYPPASFHAAARPEQIARKEEIAAIVAAGGSPTPLINALTPPVFRGEGVSSYSRPGRIPGSLNVPWIALVDPETGRFRPAAELERAFAQSGVLAAGDVIAYCGGGISATVDLFALSLLGQDGARLYDGSLTEWTADPALPVEVG